MCLWIIAFFSILVLLNNSAQAQLPPVEVTLNAPVIAMEWSHNGDRLALASDSGVILLNEQLQTLAQLPNYNQRMVSLSWTSDDLKIVGVSHFFDNRIDLYDTSLISSLLIWVRTSVNSDEFTLEYRQDYLYPESILAAAWSPDGTKLATTEQAIVHIQIETIPGRIIIRDANNPDLILSQTLSTFDYLQRAFWSDDSTKIAGFGYETCIDSLEPCLGIDAARFVVDANTGDRLMMFGGLEGTDAEWLLDGRLVVGGSDIDIYNSLLNRGKRLEVDGLVHSISRYDNHVLALISDPDRVSIINIDAESIIPIYTNEMLEQIALHPNNDYFVAFTSDLRLKIIEIPPIIPNVP